MTHRDKPFEAEAEHRHSIAGVFSKLELVPAADDHRRVLAVLTYLRAG